MKRFTFNLIIVFVIATSTTMLRAQMRPRPVVDTTCQGYVTLLTGDTRQPIRGAALSIWLNSEHGLIPLTKAEEETNWATDPEAWKRYRDEMNFNAMRLVDFDSKERGDVFRLNQRPDDLGVPPPESWSLQDKLAQIDAAVDAAEEAGMYIVINYHDHPRYYADFCGEEYRDQFGNQSWNWLYEFWDTVAVSYKDRTHVIYELVNEIYPFGNNWVSNFSRLDTLFQIVRTKAPETPLIHFSFNIIKDANAKDVVGSFIDYVGIDDPILERRGWDSSLDIVGWHAYYNWRNSNDIKSIDTFLTYTKNESIGVFMTEFDRVPESRMAGIDSSDNYYDGTDTLESFYEERIHLSWFDWKSGKKADALKNYGLDTLKQQAINENIWWPQDQIVSIEAAQSSIIIDGQKDAGYVGESYGVNNILQMQGDLTIPENLFGSWQAAWDEDNLYIFISVGDISLKDPDSGDQIWEDDGIELYLSSDYVKDHEYKNNDFRFYVRRNDLTPIYELSGNANLDAVEAVVVDENDMFYNVEIKLPWSALTLFTPPESGQLIGIDVHINDDDNTDPGREMKMSWYAFKDSVWKCPQYMGTARLQGEPVPPTPAIVYLSDLFPTIEDSTYKGCVEDQSVDGNTLSINGDEYEKGLGCHARSELVYDLEGKYLQFLTDIGIDDEITLPGCGKVEFLVFVDGELSFQSGSITSLSETVSLDIDVAGANELKLIINTLGPDYCDHGNWAGARLVSGDPIPVTGVSLEPKTLELTPGETQQLISTVIPENATNKSVSFSSSDEGIAIVDNVGKVTAIAEGTANIKVLTVDGGLKDSSSVIVTQIVSTIEYLSNMKPIKDFSSFIECNDDQSIDGNTITLNGTTYDKGLGCHAFSETVYELNGQFVRFLSDIGIDDEMATPGCGEVIFKVFLDDVLRYTSDPLTPFSNIQSLDIEVSGANELKLIIDPSGPNWCDHGDWANARLIYDGSVSPQALPNPSFNTKGSLLQDFRVYPNPLDNSELFIDQSEKVMAQYQISDMNGKQLLKGEIYAYRNSISLSKLAPGVYTVTLEQGSKRFTEKLIVK